MMRCNDKSIPDRSRPGLPKPPPVLHGRATVEIMLLLGLMKTRGEGEEDSE